MMSERAGWGGFRHWSFDPVDDVARPKRGAAVFEQLVT